MDTSVVGGAEGGIMLEAISRLENDEFREGLHDTVSDVKDEANEADDNEVVDADESETVDSRTSLSLLLSTV